MPWAALASMGPGIALNAVYGHATTRPEWAVQIEIGDPRAAEIEPSRLIPIEPPMRLRLNCRNCGAPPEPGICSYCRTP